MPDADYKIGWARPLIDHEVAMIFADSNLLTLQDRINKAARDYSLPSQHWTLGIPPVPVTNFTTNERSKPMGLTKEHEYKNVADGRKLFIEKSADDHRSAYIHVNNESDGAGIWLDYADTVPLALNVLGYDRPAPHGGAWEATTVNGQRASMAIPTSQHERDASVAQAIDRLRGADIYDQRADERKATEEAKKARGAKLQAERDALLAARDAANVALHEAANRLGRVGIYPDSIAGLTRALTARNETQAALAAHVDGV